MPDQDVLDRLDRVERTLKRLEVVLVRLEWKLEEAGMFPGNTFYGSDEQRFALEHNIEYDSPASVPWDRITVKELNEVLDWLGKHEDQENIRYRDLEAALPHLKEKLGTILQHLHLRRQYESTIARLSKTLNGSPHWIRNPYDYEKKPRSPPPKVSVQIRPGTKGRRRATRAAAKSRR